MSGWLDPDTKTHTDITSQTVGLLKDLQKFLAAQKLTLGDVVMMHVYLAADPAKDGKMAPCAPDALRPSLSCC